MEKSEGRVRIRGKTKSGEWSSSVDEGTELVGGDGGGNGKSAREVGKGRGEK